MEIIDTGLQFNSNYSSMKTIEGIVLHHSGVTVLQSVETIHNYHKSKGWAGIGYHYYVRKDGSIYRGRPENMSGAHCPGVNSISLGICAEGDFEQEVMNDIQKNAIVELIKNIKARYNIKWIKGHREIVSTDCPGNNYPLEEIINLANNTETINSSFITNENEQIDIKNDGKINCMFDIQEWLNNHYNFNLALDNIYGPDTHKKMVMALQTELNNQYNAGLAVDGIFGNRTYNACINVRQGAEGNITKLIQIMLFAKGYTIGIDGIFGSETALKLAQFQSDNNLTTDKICGKNTFKKLFE